MLDWFFKSCMRVLHDGSIEITHSKKLSLVTALLPCLPSLSPFRPEPFNPTSCKLLEFRSSAWSTSLRHANPQVWVHIGNLRTTLQWNASLKFKYYQWQVELSRQARQQSSTHRSTRSSNGWTLCRLCTVLRTFRWNWQHCRIWHPLSNEFWSRPRPIGT